ncbi:hypothetical protein KA001_00300 [Patescibacteria group bacterium]|nr:hypothetical protein [Patescibacteria group bacterium]
MSSALTNWSEKLVLPEHFSKQYEDYLRHSEAQFLRSEKIKKAVNFVFKSLKECSNPFWIEQRNREILTPNLQFFRRPEILVMPNYGQDRETQPLLIGRILQPTRMIDPAVTEEPKLLAVFVHSNLRGGWEISPSLGRFNAEGFFELYAVDEKGNLVIAETFPFICEESAPSATGGYAISENAVTEAFIANVFGDYIASL